MAINVKNEIENVAKASSSMKEIKRMKAAKNGMAYEENEENGEMPAHRRKWRSNQRNESEKKKENRKQESNNNGEAK